MPKNSIKDFKGLITNLDENDVSQETFTESINFIHKQGYVKYEPRQIERMTGLPDVNNYNGLPDGSFIWETGIFAILTNDPFQEEATPTKYEVLILVAKWDDTAGVSGKVHRQVWLLDPDDNTWREMSKYGNYSGDIYIENQDNDYDFTNSAFSTAIEGDAFIKIEDGAAKIYMPHDAFWLGRIQRTTHNWSLEEADRTWDQWYIDRLIDPFDATNPSMTFGNYEGVEEGVEVTDNPPTMNEFSGYVDLQPTKPIHTVHILVDYNKNDATIDSRTMSISSNPDYVTGAIGLVPSGTVDTNPFAGFYQNSDSGAPLIYYVQVNINYTKKDMTTGTLIGQIAIPLIGD